MAPRRAVARLLGTASSCSAPSALSGGNWATDLLRGSPFLAAARGLSTAGTPPGPDPPSSSAPKPPPNQAAGGEKGSASAPDPPTRGRPPKAPGANPAPAPSLSPSASTAEAARLAGLRNRKKEYWANMRSKAFEVVSARVTRAPAGSLPFFAGAPPPSPPPPPPPPPRPAAPPPLPKLRLLDPARPPHPTRDVGAFLPISPAALPEAFLPDARAGAGPWATLPRGGCGGLAGCPAWEGLAGGRVLYRGAMAALQAAVGIGGGGGEGGEGGGDASTSPSPSSPSPRQFLLAGPPGSGKSVALAALVQAARADGWVALYVPAPAQASSGGVYGWNEAAGGWDAPAAARGLAAGLLAAHGGGRGGGEEGGPGSVLDALPMPAGSTTWGDTVGAALRSAAGLGGGRGGGSGSGSGSGRGGGGGDAAGLSPPVDAFLAALAALRAQSAVPFLTAVDDYGLLHAPTSGLAGRAGARGTVAVPPGAVRTAAALRVLSLGDASCSPLFSAPPARGADVGALTTLAPRRGDTEGRRAARARVPLREGVVRVGLPRVDRTEWDALLLGWAHAAAAGGGGGRGAPLLAPALAPGSPGDVSYALTGGDPRAVRALGQVLM